MANINIDADKAKAVGLTACATLIASSLAICGPRKAKALLWVAAAEGTVLLMKYGYEQVTKKEEKEGMGDQFINSKVVW